MLMVSVQTIPVKHDINNGESTGNLINCPLFLDAHVRWDVATDCTRVCVRMSVAQGHRRSARLSLTQNNLNEDHVRTFIYAWYMLPMGSWQKEVQRCRGDGVVNLSNTSNNATCYFFPCWYRLFFLWTALTLFTSFHKVKAAVAQDRRKVPTLALIVAVAVKAYSCSAKKRLSVNFKGKGRRAKFLPLEKGDGWKATDMWENEGL